MDSRTIGGRNGIIFIGRFGVVAFQSERRSIRTNEEARLRQIVLLRRLRINFCSSSTKTPKKNSYFGWLPKTRHTKKNVFAVSLEATPLCGKGIPLPSSCEMR